MKEDDHHHNRNKKKKSNNIVEDNSKNGEKNKTVKLKSCIGSVFFSTPIDPCAKKGNEQPQAHQKKCHRKEDDHHNRKKKKSNNIVEDNSKNGEKDKTVKLKSCIGSIFFNAPINPCAKKGNEQPQAHQKKRQRKEDDHHRINGVGNNEIVWLKHYNNKQKILMVGEGDFSFSASLAVAFGSSASNITATSFNDSANYLRCNYKKSTRNIEKLTNRGATVIHGVDATKMSNYLYWKGMKFDRIIYNFPFSGCSQSEPPQTRMRQHLELVSGFLMNAKEMLKEGGEIHISHKTNKKHLDWNLKGLAMSQGLLLVEEAKFNKGDYPGYETKQGYTRDNNFDCKPSSTYMFVSIPSRIGSNWSGYNLQGFCFGGLR